MSQPNKPQTTTSDYPSIMYRAMIYFAVATIYFYREDIKPVLNVGEFRQAKKNVLDIVFRECMELMKYELSAIQMDRAIVSYLAKHVALKDVCDAT